MELYLKLENETLINNTPVLGDNLKQVLGVEEISDALAKENGYVRVVLRELPVGIERKGEVTYELREDGLAYEVTQITEITQEQKLELWIRRPRNHFLLMSDWTQMPDAPLTAEKKAEWAAYRQELRDMTITYANIEDPSEIVVPVEPSK